MANVLGGSAWNERQWEPDHTRVIHRDARGGLIRVRTIRFADTATCHMRSNVYHDGAACGESGVRHSEHRSAPEDVTCDGCAAILAGELLGGRW